MNKGKAGICPACNAEIKNYGEADYDNDLSMSYFPWTCDNCKATGKEYYEDAENFGECPDCGEGVSLGDPEVYRYGVNYDCECDYCGFIGYVDYDLIFNRNVLDKDAKTEAVYEDGYIDDLPQEYPEEIRNKYYEYVETVDWDDEPLDFITWVSRKHPSIYKSVSGDLEKKTEDISATSTWSCPVCGCESLEYDSLELEGNSLGYPWECTECGSQGCEWYTMKFEEIVSDYDDDVVGHEEGICPCCGDYLDYDSLVPDGMDAYYEVVCCNCDFIGKEWYDVKFDEHEITHRGTPKITESKNSNFEVVWANDFSLEKLKDIIANDFDNLKEAIDICYIEDLTNGTSVYLAKYNNALYLTLSEHNKADFNEDFDNKASVLVDKDKIVSFSEDEFKKYINYFYKYLLKLSQPIKLGGNMKEIQTEGIDYKNDKFNVTTAEDDEKERAYYGKNMTKRDKVRSLDQAKRNLERLGKDPRVTQTQAIDQISFDDLPNTDLNTYKYRKDMAAIHRGEAPKYNKDLEILHKSATPKISDEELADMWDKSAEEVSEKLRKRRAKIEAKRLEAKQLKTEDIEEPADVEEEPINDKIIKTLADIKEALKGHNDNWWNNERKDLDIKYYVPTDKIIEEFEPYEIGIAQSLLDTYETPRAYYDSLVSEGKAVYDGGDNTYNFNGRVQNDLDWAQYKVDGNYIVVVTFHVAGDIRGNYTDYAVLEFEYDSQFLEVLNDVSTENGLWFTLEVDGVQYELMPRALDECLEVYNPETEDYIYGIFGINDEEVIEQIREAVNNKN